MVTSRLLSQIICAYSLLFNIKKVTSVASNECSNKDGIDMCNYISNEELNVKINNLYENYSSQNLIVIGDIGKSVKGEDLKYLKITANANSTRPLMKPMFK